MILESVMIMVSDFLISSFLLCLLVFFLLKGWAFPSLPFVCLRQCGLMDSYVSPWFIILMIYFDAQIVQISRGRLFKPAPMFFCDVLIILWVTPFLSGTGYSRFMVCLPSPSPEISHFSRNPHSFLVEMVLEISSWSLSLEQCAAMPCQQRFSK